MPIAYVTYKFLWNIFSGPDSQLQLNHDENVREYLQYRSYCLGQTIFLNYLLNALSNNGHFLTTST
jgi:hypothetical protein